MTTPAPILCIGSVLWDTVGRSDRLMKAGHDVPGRILRIPGGVAMNIAMALRQLNMPVALLSALGDDATGRELLLECTSRGMDTQNIHISPDHPTDQYMAIEGSNGLIAAIADAHSLEVLADQVIAPLRDGRLGSPAAPWRHTVIAEGNLPQETLAHISTAAEFSVADIRLAPASPGKAERLAPFVGHEHATIYVNLIEARILLGNDVATSAEAARHLSATGLYRAIVTDGANATAVASKDRCFSKSPPEVRVLRVTGAGDVFMASHIAAEQNGLCDAEALEFALDHTANYISTETPL
ncbi:MAG: kinase [Rhodobacteraceae bacterium]|nr:kinase [Paracoccaceae bacterium]